MGSIASMLSIARKDLTLILRDPAAAFFTFIFPLLIAVMFGFFFGGGKTSGNLTVGVVDLDRTPESIAFVGDLESVDGIKVRRFEIPEDASRSIRRGELRAAVVLPQGFGESVSNVFAGGGMKIEGYIAPGSPAESGLLTGKLTELGFQRMIDSFSNFTTLLPRLDRARKSLDSASDLTAPRKSAIAGMLDSLGVLSREMESEQQPGQAANPPAEGKAGADSPADASHDAPGDVLKTRSSLLDTWRPINVAFEEIKRDASRPQSSFEVSFAQGVVWGLMSCTLTFGISLAEERTRGTLLRLTISPLSRSQILLGKAIGCFVACTCVQVLLMLISQIPPFSVEISRPWSMAAAILLSSIGFTGIMMLLAGLSKTETAASGGGRAIMLILALIGGGSVPLFLLPAVVQQIGSISPFKWSTLLLEGGLWRQFSMADMAIPAMVMLAIGIGGWLIGSATFRWQE
ncbi:MAG TPA: ABC transporter permease [Phycisphaerales bacterium]|nr:ABC transporter permease [Phycisphaerales bacterium]